MVSVACSPGECCVSSPGGDGQVGKHLPLADGRACSQNGCVSRVWYLSHPPAAFVILTDQPPCAAATSVEEEVAAAVLVRPGASGRNT